MKDAKPIKTPMGTNGHLDLDTGGKSVDQKVYRSMIESLLYLYASRPDIMISVCMCKIDRKSTSGTCQFLWRSLLSWASKKQNSVALSTAEAEYIAAGHCCAQLLWMRQTLRDYGYKLSKVPLLCDNENAIRMTDNPVEHSRTKHIDIRYHFLRDHQQSGDIEITYVSTKEQLVDIFTKPLDEKTFSKLRNELNILDSRNFD
jgi:hypothetical protein